METKNITLKGILIQNTIMTLIGLGLQTIFLIYLAISTYTLVERVEKQKRL